MVRAYRVFMLVMLLFCTVAQAGDPAGIEANAGERDKTAAEKPLWALDFSDVEDMGPEPTQQYLKAQGIEFAIEASDIRMEIRDGRLWLSTQERDTVFFGIQLPDGESIPASRAELIWGVRRFPGGANWEKRINRVAIAAMFALGTETFSSGLPFGINAAPYFLSPFIGELETVGKLYTGRLYQEAGRYICVANQSGRIVTHFDLAAVFQQAFSEHYGKPGLPPVTAIGLQMNTKSTHGGAEAFVESVRLYR